MRAATFMTLGIPAAPRVRSVDRAPRCDGGGGKGGRQKKPASFSVRCEPCHGRAEAARRFDTVTGAARALPSGAVERCCGAWVRCQRCGRVAHDSSGPLWNTCTAEYLKSLFSGCCCAINRESRRAGDDAGNCFGQGDYEEWDPRHMHCSSRGSMGHASSAKTPVTSEGH